MFRIRSLVVATAAAALTFSGVSAASASPEATADRDHGVRAEIVYIDGHARVDDWGKVRVEATYKCWGKSDKIVTTVTLKQERSGAKYNAWVKGDLKCDGCKHTQKVKLSKDSRERVRNGEAKVTWEYSTWKKSLDKEYAKVWVKGAKGKY